MDLTRCMENKETIVSQKEEYDSINTNVYIFDSCIVYINRMKHYITIKWNCVKNIWQLYDDMHCQEELKQISFQNANELIEEGGYMFFYIKNKSLIYSKLSFHLPRWFIKNKIINNFEKFKTKCNIKEENQQKINKILEEENINYITIFCSRNNDNDILICIGQTIPFLWKCFSLEYNNDESKIEYVNTNKLIEKILKHGYTCFLRNKD